MTSNFSQFSKTEKFTLMAREIFAKFGVDVDPKRDSGFPKEYSLRFKKMSFCNFFFPFRNQDAVDQIPNGVGVNMAKLHNFTDLTRGTIFSQYESQGLPKIARISARLMNILH